VLQNLQQGNATMHNDVYLLLLLLLLLLLRLPCRCADSQDEHGRWNNYHDDHDHEGHSIDW
jgi:hypothetical protein